VPVRATRLGFLWFRLPPVGYPRSVTSGQRSSRPLRIHGPWVTAVQVALIALKLTGIIDWSWWWVLVPLWCTVTLLIALIGGFLVLLMLQHREAPLVSRRILKFMVEPGHFPGTRRRHMPGDNENW
jgi:uncharacterized YccA/Bax inhibitor family protein